MSHEALWNRLLSGTMRRKRARANRGARGARHSLPCPFEELEIRELLSSTATHLVVGLQPTNGYLGLPNPFALTVELTDDNGDIVKSDHSTVTLAVDTGPAGGLKGPATAHAVNGVATFSNLLFNADGDYTLTASDGSLTPVTTGNIHVVDAPVPTTLQFTEAPVSDPTGASFGPIEVSVLDQYGNAFGTPATVTLSLDSPPAGGQLAGKLSVKTSGGAADFSGISVNSAGTYSIVASAVTSNGTLTVETSPLVMGGPTLPSQLAFGQPPTDTLAGATINPAVTVDVEDSNGNVVTTDHSKVTLTVASGPGTFKKVTATAKNGVATFSKLKLTVAGAYTLGAADGSLAPATSNTFNIIAAPATKLVFTQIPANGDPSAGPATVIVQAEDKFGNVDTTNTASVALITASAPKGVPQQSATVSADAGVVTFSGLAFPEAGKYSLKAVSEGLTSATTKSFSLT